MKRDRALALGQGLYYVATGIWPLLNYRSFERVTGPKVDDWLVKTVGLLIASSGAVLLRAGLRDEVDSNVAILASTQALALAGVSTYYSLRGRISKIYLPDGVSELVLAGSWFLLRRRRRKSVPYRTLRVISSA